jgi:hypothetical protein
LKNGLSDLENTDLMSIKTFLTNLYSYCTLNSTDPERFAPNMMGTIEGASPQEKIKLFADTVGRIRSSFENEFLVVFNEIFEEFEKSIIDSV